MNKEDYNLCFDGKTVMVTGGLGFIGSNVVKKLAELEKPPKKIIIIDSMLKQHGANLFNILDIKDKVEIPEIENGGVDIRDSNKLAELIKGVDYIFNLAGSTSHLGSKKNPLQDLELNLASHVALLEVCRKYIEKEKEMGNNPQLKIIFAGTRGQYGKIPERELPVKEDYLITDSTDPQGINNYAAEFYHLWYRNFGIKSTSLRLTNTYGPRHAIKDPDQGFLNWFIRQAINGETIKLWGGGGVLRDFNYVDDVAEAFLMAAASEKSDGKCYNLGAYIKKSGRYEEYGENLKTVAEAAETVIKIAGSGNLEKIEYPEERKAIEPGHFCSDATKIYEEIGWKPKTSFEEGIKKTVDFYKENFNKYVNNENKNKLNVLVTGALGHIGSRLIRDYVKREDIGMIRILDNLSTQRYCSLFNLPENKFEFIEGDVNDVEAVKKAVENIDIVIHLAAITDAPATINKPEETFKVNLEGTRNLLNASCEANVKKFLFPSTTSVYGEAEGIVDENYEDLKPSSPYAEAKLAAEKIVLNAYKEKGLNTNVLRMGTIFGTSIGMRFHTAVNKFIYLSCMNKPLTVWENALDQKRPYLDLRDDIRAFEFIEKNGKPGELYNVLTENYTVRDIVEAIKEFNPDVKIDITKSPILNQKSYTVSNKKLIDLGFKPAGNLRSAVKESIELFKNIKN